MNLDELNKLSGEAGRLERLAGQQKRNEEFFAQIRKSDKPLSVAIHDLGHWHEKERSLLQGLINEFGSDILRLAEMRAEARARLYSTQAQMARRQIEAVIGTQQKEGDAQ
jgi:hypothetical protein